MTLFHCSTTSNGVVHSTHRVRTIKASVAGEASQMEETTIAKDGEIIGSAETEPGTIAKEGEIIGSAETEPGTIAKEGEIIGSAETEPEIPEFKFPSKAEIEAEEGPKIEIEKGPKNEIEIEEGSEKNEIEEGPKNEIEIEEGSEKNEIEEEGSEENEIEEEGREDAIQIPERDKHWLRDAFLIRIKAAFKTEEEQAQLKAKLESYGFTVNDDKSVFRKGQTLETSTWSAKIKDIEDKQYSIVQMEVTVLAAYLTFLGVIIAVVTVFSGHANRYVIFAEFVAFLVSALTSSIRFQSSYYQTDTLILRCNKLFKVTRRQVHNLQSVPVSDPRADPDFQDEVYDACLKFGGCWRDINATLWRSSIAAYLTNLMISLFFLGYIWWSLFHSPPPPPPPPLVP